MSSFEQLNNPEKNFQRPGVNKSWNVKHIGNVERVVSREANGEQWHMETIPADDPAIKEKHEKLIASGWIWANENKSEDRFRVYEKLLNREAA